MLWNATRNMVGEMTQISYFCSTIDMTPFFLFSRKLKMPHTYQQKSNCGSWIQEQLQQAVEAMQNGLSFQKVSKTFSTPEKILQTNVKN